MKLRISRELHQRARACADAVGDRLCVWCHLAVKSARKGTFIGVAYNEKLLNATRENSTVITLHGDLEPESYRRIIAMAVAFCESRNPPPFTPPAGLKFIIAKQEDQ